MCGITKTKDSITNLFEHTVNKVFRAGNNNVSIAIKNTPDT